MNHIKQDKMFSTTTELDFEEYYRFSLQLVNKSWFSSTIIFCGFISIIGTKDWSTAAIFFFTDVVQNIVFVRTIRESS